MVLGRRVQLFYPGLTRDRYDRALAHVVTIDAAGPGLWLNRAMIEQGAARVRLYGSTSARGLELLQLEAEVRDAGRGLWSLSAYSVLDVTELNDSEQGYAIVQGVLGASIEPGTQEQFPPACIRALDGSNMVLRVDRDARSVCGLAAKTPVQVRGWISDGALSLRHPWHLESLPTD